MKILITGLGSIGQRHARNLKTLLGDRAELVAWRTRNLALPQDLADSPGRRISMQRSRERPDAVFITNPSSLHSRQRRRRPMRDARCSSKNRRRHMGRGDRLIDTVERRGSVAMLGYQFAFSSRDCLRVRDLLRDGAIGRVIAARLDFGEYLPGWHPYEDYRNSYAANRALGGGVLLSQIHEFDYLLLVVGTCPSASTDRAGA